MKKITLILFAVLFLGTIQAQKDITLENLWQNYTYYAKSVPGFNFMNDGKHYTRLEENKINKYDLTTGAFVETILSGEAIKTRGGFNGEIGNYTFHTDESKIVIESERESIYRRSSKAYFYVYDRQTKELTPIYEEDKIMYATLSPDGKKVAYVWKNNLYYFDIAEGITLPVTMDGEMNKIINGGADWVYEEEFSFAKAFAWSSDSKKIAYYRFDESAVKEFTMTNYKGGLYPDYETFKYPKVGEDNAKVSIHIFNIESEKGTMVKVSDKIEYIPRIKWTKAPNNLVVYTMNRHQNELELLVANASTGATKTLLKETNPYYIDITDDMTFLEDGKHFVWTSEKTGFNHIYLYDMSGKEVRALTKGDYDVTAFYGVDEVNDRVFYQAAKVNAMQRELYSVGMKGKKTKQISTQKGTNRAQFSSTFDYYVNTYSNINTPATYTVYNRAGDVIRVIEDNQNMKTTQKEFGVTNVEFIKTPSGGKAELNGYMIKPPNFDTNKKYPVLMYVYGGPGSQTVNDAWGGQNYWWFQMLAQQGYIVVSVDNRGTGARGQEFKKMTYLQLGKYEVEDQIAAAKHLGAMDYVDEDRIGIFGWSYGGYMSSLCLFKGNDVFKAAIAVAPVTSWRWYDTIYTERYMRTEAENPEGYADNSPVYFTDMLKGNYLLVHGNSDDNVHFQNSAEMVNALIDSNKQFDTYFYPNRNHGIYGGVTRLHLYTKMTNFLKEKL